MQIEFIASFATITTDPAASRALYVDALGLPLDHAPGDDYIHSETIAGSKHFGRLASDTSRPRLLQRR